MQIKINKLPQSIVEIEGELEAEAFESYYSKALKLIGENIEIDGFRKGKAPEAIILSKVPEIKILEEMAELALAEHYPKILEDNKIDAISRPEIMITKLARNNALGFKIKTAVLPEVKMADYKKIAKEIIGGLTDEEKNTNITEEEIEKVILDIRTSRAPKVEVPSPLQEKAEDEVDSKPHPDPLLKGEGDILQPILPEFNDEFVQAMGPFENIADFKTKISDNMKLEKENNIKEKTRIKIIEKIIEKSEMDVPEILIESETNKILQRMESDITQMGMKFEDYLKHLKKTDADLRTDFRKDAEQRSKLSLVLNEIAKIENLKPEEVDVEHEVEHILEHYKDADPERARAHTENVLTNEKVFQFLEAQK
ncbi:MAG: trigger factor [Candidatus Nomurabacteria bacterium]|nr:trigger factor [Candidatus Nomurabacteria bacterium]